MGEGFRLDDLRRCKKGDYVNKRPLGVYVTGASAKNLKVTGGPSNDEGYVYFFDAPLGWQEHYTCSQNTEFAYQTIDDPQSILAEKQE